MKNFLFYILLFASSILRGQINVAGGLPRSIPIKNEYFKIHYDSIAKKTYLFKSPNWFYQGDLVRASIPYDTTYLVSAKLITVSYTDAKLYNTTTKSWWYYDYSTASWWNDTKYSIDSLLSTNNNWTGKNRFSDSLTADKGLKSGGLIETSSFNAGTVSTNAITVTVTGTDALTQNLVYCNPSADITRTLPTSPPNGYLITYKRINATAAITTIVPNSGQTLESGTQRRLLKVNRYIALKYNSGQLKWYEVGE